MVLNRFGDIGLPQTISGYICMILYGMCVSGFCSFINESLSSKTASFFLSSVILLLLSICHLLPQYIRLPAFFQSILTSVSVAWHTDAATKGIIDTRDIVFFLSITVLFIWLGVIKRESSKKKKVFFYNFIIICAGILTVTASNLYYIRLDTTDEKQFSLSETGKKVINAMPGPLSITYYLSPELEPLYPLIRDVKDYLNILASENKNISVLTVDPAEAEIQKNLEALGVISQQLQTTQDNKTSYISVYSSLLLEYGSNSAVIPFILSTSSLEFDILTRIRSLTSGTTSTVLVYTGNGLESDTEYPYLKPWLQSTGFICMDIRPEELYDYKVSSNTILLVLGSSKASPSDAAAIENWMLNGGNIFFALNTNKTDIQETWKSEHSGTDSIIEMLDFWGIGIDSGLCGDNNSCYTIRMYNSTGSDEKYINYPYWIYTDYNEHIITESSQPIMMYWSSPLYFASKTEVKVETLVKTSDKAWLIYPDDTEGTYITDPFLINNLEHDKKTEGQYVLAAALEGKLSGCYDRRLGQEVRLVIAGDQYFLSSIVENTNSLYSNMDFLLSSVLWLNGDEDLISIKNKSITDTSLYKIKSEEDFSKETASVKILCLIIMPLSFIIMYIFVYIIRLRILSFLVGRK
ncbi:MAG: GldG family protein [Treponemataceae bacterium]|nr:GldG family protein [Treponemataceae bacterium]